MRNLDKKLSHLEPFQRHEHSKLIWNYKQLFSDVPTITNKTCYDVDFGSSLPIKQHPYRMNTIKQKYLQEEIQYSLDNNFSQPSKSAWSSPCILVSKPDKSYRLCTDYRKVNNVTKT